MVPVTDRIARTLAHTEPGTSSRIITPSQSDTVSGSWYGIAVLPDDCANRREAFRPPNSPDVVICPLR
jgi:hypothetical protein